MRRVLHGEFRFHVEHRDAELDTLSVVIPRDRVAADQDVAPDVLEEKFEVQLGCSTKAPILHP